MWHLRTRFSCGFGSAGVAVGLDDLRDLFQHKLFYDSMNIPRLTHSYLRWCFLNNRWTLGMIERSFPDFVAQNLPTLNCKTATAFSRNKAVSLLKSSSDLRNLPVAVGVLAQWLAYLREKKILSVERAKWGFSLWFMEHITQTNLLSANARGHTSRTQWCLFIDSKH